MMFCPNCGTQLPDGSVFCSKCGANLAAAQQPQQQPQYQQPQYQPQEEKKPPMISVGFEVGGVLGSAMNAAKRSKAQKEAEAQQLQYQQPQYQQPQYQQQYVPQDDGTHKMSVRTASRLCYWFSFIGWVICYCLADNKNPYLRFHLNQSLILWVIGLVMTIIPRILPYGILATIANLLGFVVFVLWIIAFIGACRNQTKTPPLLDKIPPILK